MPPVPPVTRIMDASLTILCQLRPDVHLGGERQVDRAAIGNRQQPRPLFLVQDAFELDVSFNEREYGRARFARGTIFSVDARMTEANRDTLQCPLLPPCVHRDGHGRARAKCQQAAGRTASGRCLFRPLMSVRR